MYQLLGVSYKYAPNQKKDYPFKVLSYIENLRNTFDYGKDKKTPCIIKTVVLVVIFLKTVCLGCSIPLLRAEELKTDITQSKDKANLLDNSRAK